MNKRIPESIIKNVARYAAKREILLGIDPESTLGRDILRQNFEIVSLRSEITELKKMVADISNHLGIKKKIGSGWNDYNSPKSSS